MSVFHPGTSGALGLHGFAWYPTLEVFLWVSNPGAEDVNKYQDYSAILISFKTQSRIVSFKFWRFYITPVSFCSVWMSAACLLCLPQQQILMTPPQQYYSFLFHSPRLPSGSRFFKIINALGFLLMKINLAKATRKTNRLANLAPTGEPQFFIIGAIHSQNV